MNALIYFPLVLLGCLMEDVRVPQINDRSPFVFQAGDSSLISHLRRMREEEKMARDVYRQFYSRFSLPVFGRIEGSEQRHMDAMLSLLNRFRIPDPAAGNKEGVFLNEELKKLYDGFIRSGTGGAGEALQAAARVEELDIRDLREGMGRITDAYVLTVYGNLLAASENHLRAFVRNLTMRGMTYHPVYLDEKDAKKIQESGGKG